MIQQDIDLELVPLRKSIYMAVAGLAMEAWTTAEPVPFARRREGRFRKLEVGDAWGERLFDCAWFHFTGTVPEEWRGESLVARISVGGEVCLVDGQGNPVRGLTAFSSIVPQVALGGPLKSVYELPAEMVRSGEISLWGDAGFNGLFGEIPDTGRVAMAEIATVDRERRALYYDLELIGSYLTKVNDPANPRYRRYKRVFDEACALAEVDLPQARRICRRVLGEQGGDALLTVTAVGHSHLDLAWLWPIRETIRKAARTFSTALYNIERYPDYVFGASQPQQYAWMKERHPALYERIKAAVQAGRIEPQGCMWVEADMNIPGGESLVRQILHGCRFFREEFGVEPDHLWLPDVFGYNAQLPQILKKAGMRYFMTQKLSWNRTNRFPHHSFRWVGIDGSEVLAHMLPESTYNGHASLASIHKIQQEYRQIDVSGHALMLYGIGDGGGGPDAEHLERLARAKNLPGLSRVVSRSAREFFAEWAREAERFPTWRGELYLECHQGTFTTQALTKKNNRTCERLLRELEWVGILAERLCGMDYPELDEIWQEVLLYQFHDILPGSSIQRVYDESNARYRVLIDRLEKEISARYRRLAAGLAQRPGQNVFFNSLPWERTEWICSEGRWSRITVPGMGYAVSETSVQADPSVEAGDNRIENEFVRIEFAPDGSIRSLCNKQLGREMIPPDRKGNRFAVYADHGHAWDAPSDIRDTPPKRATLAGMSFEIDGPRAVCLQEYRVGNSTIRQRISVADGSPLVEFDTELDWQDHQTMLRVEFPLEVQSDTARYEIQFGEVERPAHDNTSWDSAKDEVPHQQWMDLSQADCGVAVLNDCKYGGRIKNSQMELTLLRCVPSPQGVKALIAKRSDPDRKEIYGDLGSHRFRYALYAHGADADLVPLARCFNSPLFGIEADAAAGSAQATGRWLEIGDERVDLAAVKKAEDGRGIILRLVMTKAANAHVEIRLALPFGQAEEVDLQERHCSNLQVRDVGVRVEMKPYEIKSIRLC